MKQIKQYVEPMILLTPIPEILTLTGSGEGQDLTGDWLLPDNG